MNKTLTTVFPKAILASAISLVLGTSVHAAEETANAGVSDDLEVVEVRGATPLTTGPDAATLFGNSQTLTSKDIERAMMRSLPELLKTQLASVNLNDVQNNPFQPDLQYRGFTASPLLGLPQGISVYLNGARVNEVFGDTVNWDLMPLDAINTVSLYLAKIP